MASVIKVDQIQADSGSVQLIGGLKFPATQVPNSDANVLDDYKEGTWTPTLISNGGTNPTSVTYSYQHGRYTKIGNLVTVACFLSGTYSGGSGQYAIGGLPYAPTASGPDFYPAVQAALGYLPDGAYAYVYVNSPSLINIGKTTPGAGLSPVNFGDTNVNTTQFQSHFVLTYFVN
jgi:hypothetical protein